MYFFITLTIVAIGISATTFVPRKNIFHAPGFSTADTVVQDNFNLSILTPDLQARRSSKLILGNGVNVFIVSDPGVIKARAALSVETGSWRDPEGVSGLGTFRCWH